MAEAGQTQKRTEVGSNAKTTSLSPSDIYFIPCAGSKDDVNHNIASVCSPSAKTVKPDGDGPILQVVEKGGVYFTLDNNRLSEAKRQHRSGQCPTIPVEVVPLENVPQGILDRLVLPVPVRQKGRLHGKGPLKLLNFIHPEKRNSLTGVCSTDEDTDESTDRSDSECDWTADVK